MTHQCSGSPAAGLLPPALQVVFKACLHSSSLEAESWVTLTQEKEDVEGSVYKTFARGDLITISPGAQWTVERAQASEDLNRRARSTDPDTGIIPVSAADRLGRERGHTGRSHRERRSKARPFGELRQRLVAATNNSGKVGEPITCQTRGSVRRYQFVFTFALWKIRKIRSIWFLLSPTSYLPL